MRALTLGLCLILLCCSEQIELFPPNQCLDAGPSDPTCCTGVIGADGVLRPCGCLASCSSDADCPDGRCDVVVALCIGSEGACATAADCSRLRSGARGWLCQSAASR